MKIVVVLTEMVTGGAEIFCLHLAAALEKQGHQLTLITLRGEACEPQLLKKYWPAGEVIHYRHSLLPLILKIDGLLNRLRLDHSLLSIFQVLFLGKLLKQLQPDVVHSHLFKTDLVVMRALATQGTPWITTIHGDYLGFQQACTYRFSYCRHFRRRCRWIDQRIDQVVVISELQRSVMAQLLPLSQQRGRHRLIINGLATPAHLCMAAEQRALERRKLGLSPDGLVVAMLARGVPEKGWDVLIHAFQQAQLSSMQLLLIGEGPALRSLAKQNSDPRIHFYGRSADPMSLLQLCDLTCLPSRFATESCPLAVMESLAAGVPVIATRLGQISWLLDENTAKPAGLTLPLQDSGPLASALAAQLQTIDSQPQLLRFWQLNCLAACQKFAIERCAQDYLEAYQAAGA